MKTFILASLTLGLALASPAVGAASKAPPIRFTVIPSHITKLLAIVKQSTRARWPMPPVLPFFGLLLTRPASKTMAATRQMG